MSSHGGTSDSALPKVVEEQEQQQQVGGTTATTTIGVVVQRGGAIFVLVDVVSSTFSPCVVESCGQRYYYSGVQE